MRKKLIIRLVLLAIIGIFARFLLDSKFNLFDIIAPVALVLGIINERMKYDKKA